MPVAGAVLCGGASRRMGHDKALIDIDGVPMAERVARVLESAGCRPVRFIGGDAGPLGATGRDVLPDAFPGQGPLGGVITALRASEGPVVVAACDLVDLDIASVAAVVGRGSGSQPRAADSGRLEPMLSWWPGDCLAQLEQCFDDGVRALHDVLEAVGFQSVAVAPGPLHNVNTVTDIPRSAPSGAPSVDD